MAESSSVELLVELFQKHEIDSVIHLAARKRVDESMRYPAYYYQQNIGGLSNVLVAMGIAGINQLVFSSSAAVYGDVKGNGAVAESDPTEPVNPYGRTKLIGETMISEFTQANSFHAISLRYFNVAGAGRPELGDTAVLNLVPMVFERIDAGRSPLIFGMDYETPDGTCVRDFIDVRDLAEAHAAALLALRNYGAGHRVYNVGTGTGTSVQEIVEVILEVAKSDLAIEIQERREGDPARVIADATLIEQELGWKARRSVREMIESAWQSHQYFLVCIHNYQLILLLI